MPGVATGSPRDKRYRAAIEHGSRPPLQELLANPELPNGENYFPSDFRHALALRERRYRAGRTQHDAWQNVLLTTRYFPSPTFFLLADLDRDGTFETDWTDRTAAFTGGFNIRRGLNQQHVYQASTLSFGLDNTDGEMTPEYESSSFFGQIFPAMPIRIDVSYGAGTYQIWTGYVTDFEATYLPGPQNSVEISAEDLFGLLGHYRDLSATASTTRRSDQAISELLSNVGLTSADWDLATGQQTLALHYAAGDDAIAAVMEAVRSEMGGIIWVTKAGKIKFEARNTRLGVTVDDTWGDGTNIVPVEERYLDGFGQLRSRVSLEVSVFTADPAAKKSSRWNRSSGAFGGLNDSIALATGQVYTTRARYRSPASSPIAPAANTDYKANDAADGGGTDRTSSLNVTFTDYGGEYEVSARNDHTGTIYITKWGVRGTGRQPAPVESTPIFRFEKAIPGLKTDGSIDLKLNYVDDSPTTAPKAQDYAMHLLRLWRWPIPTHELTFTWKNADTVNSMLSRDIGDLVRYTTKALGNEGSYVDEWYYIESIEHGIGVPAGIGPDIAAGVQTRFRLTPSWAFRNLDAIIYDDFTRANASTLGRAQSNEVWSGTGISIASNEAKPSTTAETINTLDLGVSDMILEMDAKHINSAETNAAIGFVFRYADANNYYRVMLDPSVPEVRWDKVSSGFTLAVSAVSLTGILDPLGDTVEMRLLVQGTRHRLWLRNSSYPRGRLVYDETHSDAALDSNTKCGLYFIDTTTLAADDYFAEGL